MTIAAPARIDAGARGARGAAAPGAGLADLPQARPSRRDVDRHDATAAERTAALGYGG
jgi:hypothetical protein